MNREQAIQALDEILDVVIPQKDGDIHQIMEEVGSDLVDGIERDIHGLGEIFDALGPEVIAVHTARAVMSHHLAKKFLGGK